MRAVALSVLCLCTTGGAFGQTPAAQSTFEVASVKPSTPGVLGMFTRFPPDGSVQITGATLKSLVGIAYSVRVFQISGGPAWIDVERFDVETRVATSGAAAPNDPSKASNEQRKIGERLRNLLADRFQLALHRETKDQPVYELVVAKGGPKLEESIEGKNLIRKGSGTLLGQSVGLKMLAINLSNELDRPVIDKTGLTANYDFELKWTPIGPSTAPLEPSPTDPDRPSIFTALPEQLGLRLEMKRGPVELLVIDSAERPSAN